MTETELHQKLYPEAAAKDEYVICASLWFDDGVEYTHQPVNVPTGFVINGRRHHNCFAVLTAIGLHLGVEGKVSECLKLDRRIEEGFLTSKDRFLNRKEAGKLAYEAKQILEPTNCLFSEDLY